VTTDKLAARNHDNERIVCDLWAAWGARDEAAVMGHFSDEAIYHNMPVAPLVGIAAIRATVRAFLQAFITVEIETVSLASLGDVVHTERIDHFQVFNGNVVALPVAGTLYLSRGKITLWRDYFDLATFEAQSGITLAR
jgi:limonene-1,2-epoxide hydrolase